jgi:hypothetical protein
MDGRKKRKVETGELRGIRAQYELVTSYALTISGKCEVPFNGDVRLLWVEESTVKGNGNNNRYAQLPFKLTAPKCLIGPTGVFVYITSHLGY